MCDAYTPAGEPIPTNKRHNAAKIFSHPDVAAEEPWYNLNGNSFFCLVPDFVGFYLSDSINDSWSRYGIEQEYTLLQDKVKWPLGWPTGGYPGPQVSLLSFSPLCLGYLNVSTLFNHLKFGS